MNNLRFVVQDFGPNDISITPWIDGRSLLEIVEAHGEERGWRPTMYHAGLVPSSYDFGDPFDYWYGRRWADSRSLLWALGCECGIANCWPMEVAVTVEPERVIWSDFRQPDRVEWEYDLGPYEFTAAEYRAAIASIAPHFG